MPDCLNAAQVSASTAVSISRISSGKFDGVVSTLIPMIAWCMVKMLPLISVSIPAIFFLPIRQVVGLLIIIAGFSEYPGLEPVRHLGF
jgi:hypothetical protein